MEMPSETAIVEMTRPTPPAVATPLLACSDNSGPVTLHGVTSLPADTTPTCGLAKSSSVSPTARSMARAPALAAPSVTSVDLVLVVIATILRLRLGAPARSDKNPSMANIYYDRDCDL